MSELSAWFSPSVWVVLAVLLVPGAVMLRGLGVRGLALLALAPLASTAAIALSALVLGMAGLPWSPATLAGILAILTGLAWGIGAMLGRPGRSVAADRASPWMLPVGLGIGVALGAWRVIAYVNDPAGISQTNDAVFHMNAVRYILETANASSLHISSVIGGSGFYPGAWHAVVSMTVALTGAEVAVAANAMTLALSAVIWPLGLAWFAREVTGSARIAAFAAVLSPALQLFPLLMIQWGVLFPNALSVAMLPAAIATVIALPRWYRPERPVSSTVRSAVLIGIVLVALALSQPASIPIWGLVVVVWLSDRLLRVNEQPSLARRVLLTVAAWVALASAWLVLSRSTGGSHWPPFRDKFAVFGDIFLNSQMLIPPAWGVSVLMLVGLVVVSRHAPWRWFGVAWLGISALYVIVAVVGLSPVRNGLLGAWYADPYRLAAFAPLVVIPLAAIGLDAMVRSVTTRWAKNASPAIVDAVALALLGAGVLILALVRPVPMPAFLEGTFDRDSRYLITDDTYLSTDERALLEQLAELVPRDARVIANPSTGSAFGYVISGVDVYPRTWSPPRSPEWDLIAEGLRDAAENPEVCTALAAFDQPQYVLDFGPGEYGPGRFEMPGMTAFAGQQGFEFVAAQGDASLWRINACG